MRYALDRAGHVFLPSLLSVAPVLWDPALLRQALIIGFAWDAAMLAGMAIWAYYTVELPRRVRISKPRRRFIVAGIALWILGAAALPFFRYDYVSSKQGIVRIDRITGERCAIPDCRVPGSRDPLARRTYKKARL